LSKPTPRPGLLGITPYVGGEAQAPGAVRVIRLASNESALGPSPAALAAVRDAVGGMSRYPDGGSSTLCAALGRLHGLEPGRIVCGNGSDEVLSLVALAFAGPGDEVLYTEHGFLCYPLAARHVGATPIAVTEQDLRADVDALLARVTSRTKVVYLANPNNPTGTYLPTSEIERLHAGLPGNVVLVIDAAYAEFVTTPDYDSGFALAERTENVLVTRTFSKIYGLGGLRLGWGYGAAGLIDCLHRVRPPFNVNLMAQVAGLAAIDDQAFVTANRDHTTTWRRWLTERLRALGYTVPESVANFVLVSFAGLAGDRADAEAARLYLKARGILVRQMGVYGLPDYLRITIGRGDEMEEVVAALAAWRDQAVD